MSHNASNVISKPVDFVSDIAYVLGSAASDVGDLGRMITNGNINKWSFRKPVRSSKISEMTDADFFAVNDGFQIYTGYTSPVTLFNDMKAGSANYDWTYQKPAGGQNQWFRALDFDGYDPNAAPWFTLTINKTTFEQGQQVRLYMTVDINWLMNFAAFSNISLSGLYLTVLMRSTSSSASAQNVTSFKICDMNDYDPGDIDKMMHFSIPLSASALPLGTYEIIPCLTNDTYSPSPSTANDSRFHYWTADEAVSHPANWWTLPASPVTFTTQASVNPDEKVSLWLDSYVAEQDLTALAPTYDVSSVTLGFSNSNANSATIGARLYMRDYSINNSGRWLEFGNQSFSLAGSGNTTKTYTNTLRVVCASQSIECKVELTVVYGGNTYYHTEAFQIRPEKE